jgi:hypothetical protein
MVETANKNTEYSIVAEPTETLSAMAWKTFQNDGTIAESSGMNAIGKTAVAQAKIQSPKRRALNRSASRYENAYPQSAIGKRAAKPASTMWTALWNMAISYGCE